MYLSKKNLAVILVVALAVGFGARQIIPERKKDRPFLVFLAKAARTALWVMMFAESEEPEPCHTIVSAPLDGPFIDHARSL